MQSGLATLAELDSVYGLEDMWDLIEINAVRVNNQLRMNENGNRN